MQTTTALHFHAGWNLPGYLPENDVECFDSFADAKQYMIDSMLHQADNTTSWAEEHDCDDVPCPTYGDSCPWQKAQDISNTAEELNLDNGPDWGAFAGDLGYWINVVPAEDCEYSQGCSCTADPDTGDLHDDDGWPCSHSA